MLVAIVQVPRRPRLLLMHIRLKLHLLSPRPSGAGAKDRAADRIGVTRAVLLGAGERERPGAATSSRHPRPAHIWLTSPPP